MGFRLPIHIIVTTERIPMAPKMMAAIRKIILKVRLAAMICFKRALALGDISFAFINLVWLDRQFLFLLNLPALVHDPGDQDDDNSGKKQSEINARAKIKGEEAHLIVCDCDLP